MTKSNAALCRLAGVDYQTVLQRLFSHRCDGVLRALNEAMFTFPSAPSVMYRYVVRTSCCGTVTIGRWEQLHFDTALEVVVSNKEICSSSSASIPWLVRIDLKYPGNGTQDVDKQKENVQNLQDLQASVTVSKLVSKSTSFDGIGYASECTSMPLEHLISDLRLRSRERSVRGVLDKVCGSLRWSNGVSSGGYIKL